MHITVQNNYFWMLRILVLDTESQTESDTIDFESIGCRIRNSFDHEVTTLSNIGISTI